jgi:cell division protein FtsB
MANTKIQKIIYRLKMHYFTLNNLVIVVAFVIAASWIWGSLGMMERNYTLQREVDYQKRQLQLTELQRDNLELQNRYFETAEYQELAVRETLGLVRPGERVLILPENTVSTDDEGAPTEFVAPPQASNLEQWVNFLFGGYSRSIEE